MSDLPLGVNTGIGATRTMNTHGNFCDKRKSLLYAGLDGVCVGLDLPAREAASIIGDCHFDTHSHFLSEFRAVEKDTLSLRKPSGKSGIQKPCIHQKKGSSVELPFFQNWTVTEDKLATPSTPPPAAPRAGGVIVMAVSVRAPSPVTPMAVALAG